MGFAYPFGGFAGETVRRFIRFSTLLTLIPALILTAILEVLAFLIGKAMHLPAPVSFLLSLIFSAPVFGKYALGSREGDLESGLFSNFNAGEILRFLARYAALTLVWGVPLALAANALITGVMANPLGLMGISSARGAMMILGLFMLIVIIVFAPTLSLIVATKTQSVAECFSGETWQWMLGRRQDLPALYASIIGGTAVFAAVVVPVLLIISALAFGIRTEAGMAVLVLSYLIPGMAASVLLGRLAGAFVMSEQIPDSEEPAAEAATPTPGADVGTSEPAVAQPATLEVARAIKQWAGATDQALPEAITEAEALRTSAPHHAGLLAELAKLYLRAGRTADAVKTASDAMSEAFSSGAISVAVSCFVAFSAYRKSLILKPNEFEQLARELLSKDQFTDAAWSFSTSAKLGGEPIRVQKGLIAVAEAANRAGQCPTAAKVYEYVIQYAPGSANAEYCQNALAAMKRKKPSA